MNFDNLMQLGTVGVIFSFAIKEFFAWLKSRNGNGGNFNEEILAQLQLMNTNHLTTLQKTISEGNDKVVSAFSAHAQSENNASNQMIQLLGEIKGILSK